jgi:hypothetical protein
MDALDRVLPNRRVVLLTRDFRDNVMSVVGKSFGPRMPAVAAEYVHSRFVHYEREYRRRGGAHVRFEDLVAAPVPAIEALGREIAWCESILRRELLEYGYGLETSGSRRPTAWDRTGMRGADAALRVPQKLRRLGRRLGWGR